MVRLFSWIFVFLLLVTSSVSAQEQSEAKGHNELGVKLFGEERFMDALGEFNKAIELDSTNHHAYYMRGIIKERLEDSHGAMRDLNVAIELNPNLFEAYFERGNIKFQLQDYYGAIEDYTKTINLNENHVEAYYKRGQAKQQLDAYQDAIHDCTKIIEINPKNVDAYFLRGILRIEHGQVRQGCLDLSKAGELGDLKAYEEIKDKCNQRCYVDIQ